MRIGCIVINCYEFEPMVSFWQRALHYRSKEAKQDGFVVLFDPEGKSPSLAFQARDRRRARRSWVHLDLHTDNQEQEVNRLLQLGARKYPWGYQRGSNFVVLEDPD